jgi:Tfp pilus assembly protein PilF
MYLRLIATAVAPLLFAAAGPADAQEDGVARTKIAAGDFGQAEAKLLHELRIYPNRPELLLNLAAVYAKTGRAPQARALYMRVLSQRDVLMDLSAEETAGSHALARTGLSRLDSVQLTAR